jgi:hypothetical protein
MDKDGNEIDNPRKICPYCESDTELTEQGVIEEEASKKRMAEIDAMFNEDDSNG